MLKKLRKKKTSKKILILLACVIIPAFAFWGLSSVLESKKERMYLGKISGRTISIQDYRGALDGVKNLAILQYGDNYAQVRNSLDFDGQTWERLILIAEAKKKGINVSDKEVIDFIMSYPVFGKDGRFDHDLYKEILRYVFDTPARTFEEQTRENLIIAQLYDQATKGITISDEELRDEYKKLNQEVSLDFIYANPLDFLKEVPQDEATIKEYFDDNSIEFKQPLSFNIEYVKTEILPEEQIKKIFLQLRKKRDNFAEAAGELDLEVNSSGSFAENDPIPGIGWAPRITSLITKRNSGDLIEPIEMDNNYYIIKIAQKDLPFIPVYDAIKDQVKTAYVKNTSEKLAKKRAEDAQQELGNLYLQNPKSANLKEIAKNHGLKIGTTELFKYGSYLEGIGSSDIFWMSADKLEEAQPSEIIETSSGYYIIEVKSRVPMDQESFIADKEALAEIVLMQKKQDYFSSLLRDLNKQTRRF